MAKFEIVSDFKPTGDQPEAIEKLARGVAEGRTDQVLLGVTGSSTPPEIQISSPLYESCACGSSVAVHGLSCDPEGFDHDTLEYLAVNAAAGTPWTLVDSAMTPQCTAGGTLYYWNTTSIAEGCYYLRVTSYNDCGATSSATTVVCVDRTVDTPTVRSPVDAAILGGNVCIDGTVWDGANAACLASYRVDYKASGGTIWNPVNPASPVYRRRW